MSSEEGGGVDLPVKSRGSKSGGSPPLSRRIPPLSISIEGRSATSQTQDSPDPDSTPRSFSVPRRSGFPRASRDLGGWRPLLQGVKKLSTDLSPFGTGSPPPPETAHNSSGAARSRGGHARSASVPPGGGLLEQLPLPSEREGSASYHPASSRGNNSKGFSLIRGSSAESEFFKPIIEGRNDQYIFTPPGDVEPNRISDASAPAPAPPPGTLAPPQMGARALSGRDDEEANTRVVFFNHPERNNENTPGDNRIRSSKYTFLTFLPKNLFEQFHRYAYVYFLAIAVLNQIPQLAVFGRTASVFPLVFVLVVTAIKDAYEDWGRHRSDKEENNREALVFEDGSYKPKKWKHIRVGEIVKVHSNDSVPCDMVLLGTSDSSGVAYVETLNLDGESNLKSRYATHETAAERPELVPPSGALICELPNRNIYEFTAYMDVRGVHLPLGPKNIILRGCEVRNTAWVVGAVVYAGQETKVMLNSSGTQSKRSRLDKELNRETLWLGTFLLILCLIGGIGMGQWVARHSNDLNDIPYYRKAYIEVENGNYRYYGVIGEAIIGFLSCVIVFQIMIPIALYISMELVRLGQAYFMSRDLKMYDEASDSPFQCRALNINEDLGQVKYVFSDKTGTLTENKMEFFAASINGVDYSEPDDPVDDGFGKSDRALEEAAAARALHGLVGKKNIWRPKVAAKVDPNLVRDLKNPRSSEMRQMMLEYLFILAACNTIVPTQERVSVSAAAAKEDAAGHQPEVQPGPSSEEGGVIGYSGESPDEQALVSAAATYGYTLIQRTSTSLVMDVLGDIQRFEVLGMHEFDSVRRRMSVIIRCPDGAVKLLVKGADSVVLDLLENSDVQDDVAVQKSQAEVLRATVEHLDHYSKEGLRTLVVASRNLDAEVLRNWEVEYRKANSAVTDRAAKLRKAADSLERNLTLVGATGIDDRLQLGVPETIALLREAGIQVWMLTGDKQGTAISIALSCSLITGEMQQVIINETTLDGCREALTNAAALYGTEHQRGTAAMKKGGRLKQKRTINNVPDNGIASRTIESNDDASPSGQHSRSSQGQQPLALVIDGNSLVHCLSEELEQKLFDLADACKVVVCCRVAPLQKAAVVSLVKRKAADTTLAIGDGANDVSMIQMAHVGIGISGQEGRQAVMASDFAMGQFRFLKRLILVHGHWNYSRLGYMVLYNFYRNSVFVLMLFWYILYTAFSPQSPITDWSAVLYSVIYSSVPTIVVGILDKDVNQKTLLRNPGLYGYGQRRFGYNQPLFWAVMLDTLWQSLVVFYVPYMTYRRTQVGMYGLGSLWTIGIVILVNVHLAMDIHNWTWIEHLVIWASILVTWVCILILDSFKSVSGLSAHYFVTYHMMTEWTYWFDILLILILALLPRFIVKVFWQRFFPSDVQIAREAEVQGYGSNGTQDGVELAEVSHRPGSFAHI